MLKSLSLSLSLSLCLSLSLSPFTDVTSLARLKNSPRVNRGALERSLPRGSNVAVRRWLQEESKRAIDQTNRSPDPSVRAPNEFQLIQLSAVLISSAGRFHQRISPALVFGDPLMAKCRNVAFVQAGREQQHGGEGVEEERGRTRTGRATLTGRHE